VSGGTGGGGGREEGREEERKKCAERCRRELKGARNEGRYIHSNPKLKTRNHSTESTGTSGLKCARDC
jgi:DNA invertase Pin-like site-specific DNA recombinase